MLFSSLEFLFFFLPLCIAVYFAVPFKFKNIVLLCFSLIFYAFGEPVYLFLMIFTIFFDYLFAIAIEGAKSRKRARTILILAISLNLSLLAFFKYFDFVLISLSNIFGLTLSPLELSLPVGISFYTFQSLSYVIDVYKKECQAAQNPIIPATYVTLFPQLIAGPIIKYGEIAETLNKRHHSISDIANGVRRFTCGLAKKVILANSAGELWQRFVSGFDVRQADTVGIWFALICFAYQIYFDFSGYSDMAIGLGKIFGFTFPENFNYPYASKSITEFWRRWHITLSSFFREYVYIPLGGNRCGKFKMYLNLFIVWSLTGLWHGAGVNFLLWGIYYFIILAIEKAFLLKLLNKCPSFLCRIYSLFLILLGWLIFASDGTASSLSVNEALSCLKIMFSGGERGFISADTFYNIIQNASFLIIMTIAAIPMVNKIKEKLLISEKYSAVTLILLNTMSVSALILCTAYLVNSGYNPFLYFRF